jgi:hypothetical protein
VESKGFEYGMEIAMSPPQVRVLTRVFPAKESIEHVLLRLEKEELQWSAVDPLRSFNY